MPRIAFPRLSAFGLAVLAAALAVTLPRVARAQDRAEPKQVSIPAAGTDLFRALLDQKGITPILRRDLRNIREYDEVIVILIGAPTTSRGLNPLQHAHTAVNSGGAALIANDQTMSIGRSEALNGRFAVAEIVQADLRCDDQNQVLLVRRGDDLTQPPIPNKNCPFLVPFTAADGVFAPPIGSPIGRVFDGLTRVATNAPGYIVTDGFIGEFRYALAKYPRRTTASSERFGVVRLTTEPFAIGGMGEPPFSDYRFLAMADHSVFINQMLIEPGTQNLELAYRTIEFLQGPTERKRCLFIENGTVIEEFDGLRKAFQQGMPIPNLPPEEKWADILNGIADVVQKADLVNQFFRGEKGMPRFQLLLEVLFWVAATCACIYLLFRWLGKRKPTNLPPPPVVAGAATGPPGVFDRRQKELLRRDNLYEPVRDLVREFFASIGIHGEQGPRHPKLVIADVIRRPESLRQAIRDFWKLAFGPPQEVTVARWRELEPYFIRLRDAHANGKWRFEMPGAPVAASV